MCSVIPAGGTEIDPNINDTAKGMQFMILSGRLQETKETSEQLDVLVSNRLFMRLK